MVKGVRILFEIFIAAGYVLSFGFCTYFIYLFVFVLSMICSVSPSRVLPLRHIYVEGCEDFI